MKKILLLLLLSTNVLFANKYALIIAVGDYPDKTGWSPISSANDVPLIKSTLMNQGFPENQILVLQDEEATKENILQTLKNLNSQITEGDIVVLHYSGHGQQIFDDNAEEIDGLDEAIVPFDAWVKYSDDYKGENHIRDDEIGNILAEFRNKLGKDGQLLMLLDSCHSGSSTRGGKARGSEAAFMPDNWERSEGEKAEEGSDMFEKVKLSENAAPFVLISGASANELNYEHENQGSLSYSFSKAMNELGSDFTYRQLYSKIASIMSTISPRQTPTIEGNQDYKLFNGEYVKQQPYFELVDFPRADVVKIRAGKLQGVFDSTTVNILPAGTTKVTEDKILGKGTVVLSKLNESNVVLDAPLPSQNDKDYWAFIDEKTYGDIALDVYLERSAKDSEFSSELSNFLDHTKLGKVVSDSLTSDVMVSQVNDTYVLSATNGKAGIAEAEKNRGSAAVEDLKQQLFNFAQGQYLKNLNLNDSEFEMSFRLLPMEYDPVLERYGDTLPIDTYLNGSGVFEVRPDEDQVVLEVTNHSDRDFYFTIIEINSKGEINSFMPNQNCRLNENERKIKAGETMIFRDCVFAFGPPYEKLVLKAFASPDAIDFQPTVESRGRTKRSTTNPLESFLSETYTQTRGRKANKVGGKLEGYTTEFIYEIVED